MLKQLKKKFVYEDVFKFLLFLFSKFSIFFFKQKAHPSVIINGKEDPLFEWGSTLSEQHLNPKVIVSPEGHRIPRDEACIKEICDEILGHCGVPKL